ncbi:MAG: ABC transporter substrate-binding protein, partial [Anaerolineales bacterium]|nr:ABC transporter substrate-binding protein [Anaerolineales bacterium]
SCGPGPATVKPTESISATPAPITYADEIRFVVVGESSADVNVWALFDEQGASYAAYAVYNEYWPRLFTLSVPGREFTALAAKELPSPVIQDDEFYTAIVNLRDDLKWTDASAFTADDIVFTVQTALAFELTFDWKTFYNPAYLDHAEALDAHTVKFYFKQKPNVAVWQYGILQAPLVQKTYWESKVSEPAALLPNEALRAQIADTQSKLALLQKAIADIYAFMPTLKKNGPDYRKAETNLKRNQGDLDAVNNLMAQLQSDYAIRLSAAQTALFSLDDSAEPTLGVWMADETQANIVTNTANKDFPFGAPHFDRAVYKFYPTESEAIAAFQNGDADSILSPDGISSETANSLANDASIKIIPNQRSSARFLVFNHSRFIFSEPAFRLALDCVIDRDVLAEKILGGAAMPMESFVLPGTGFWYNADAKNQCSSMDDAARIQTTVSFLKSAGFTWTKEPKANEAGQGLFTPQGKAYPDITLLAPSAEFDAQRANAAGYIEGQARALGIPLTKKLVSSDTLSYAVYSSGDYDMALLGWRLSEYPSYLCAWFQPWNANPFHYNEDKPKSACDAFESATEIEDARTASFDVQSLFETNPPMIPLYTTRAYDVYRHLSYSFAPLGGLTSLYGAPSLAMPAP